MNNKLRKKATKELAEILKCDEEIASIVLEGMDKEAKEREAI